MGGSNAARAGAAGGEPMTPPRQSRRAADLSTAFELGGRRDMRCMSPTLGRRHHVLRRATQLRAAGEFSLAPTASLSRVGQCHVFPHRPAGVILDGSVRARLQGAGLVVLRSWCFLLSPGRQSHGQALPSWRGLQPVCFLLPPMQSATLSRATALAFEAPK